jgi:hypothetical protein
MEISVRQKAGLHDKLSEQLANGSTTRWVSEYTRMSSIQQNLLEKKADGRLACRIHPL